MSLFHYGFISGTGKETEFQLWSNETERGHLISLNLDEVNSIIGPEYYATDFRGASTIAFRSKDEKCGFTICGYHKDQMQMLCTKFTAYLSKILGVQIEPVHSCPNLTSI